MHPHSQRVILSAALFVIAPLLAGLSLVLWNLYMTGPHAPVFSALQALSVLPPALIPIGWLWLWRRQVVWTDGRIVGSAATILAVGAPATLAGLRTMGLSLLPGGMYDPLTWLAPWLLAILAPLTLALLWRPRRRETALALLEEPTHPRSRMGDRMSPTLFRTLMSILLFPLGVLLSALSVAIIEFLVQDHEAEFLLIAALWAVSILVTLVWLALWTPAAHPSARTRLAVAVSWLGTLGFFLALWTLLAVGAHDDHSFVVAAGFAAPMLPLSLMIATSYAWRLNARQLRRRWLNQFERYHRNPTICCPDCGYDLRGRCDARCPECGGEFTLERLLVEGVSQLDPDASLTN